MKKKWGWYRQTILRLSFAVMFSRYLLHLHNSPCLDRGYCSCTVIPSKIYTHAQVCGKCSSKVHGHTEVTSMHPLKRMHKTPAIIGDFKKKVYIKQVDVYEFLKLVRIHRLICHPHFWCYLERKSEMRSSGLSNKFSWKCLYLLYVLGIISNGQPQNAGTMFIKERTNGKFSW